MKICSKCKISKDLSEFYKDKTKKDNLMYCCKFCYEKNRKPENVKKRRIRDNLNYSKNCKKKKEKNSIWSKNNRDSINERRRFKYQENKLDLIFKLKTNSRDRMRKAIKGNFKSGSAVRDLGCSIKELKLWLEHQFQPGMSWSNYGKVWHIDHIIPLASFDLTNDKHFKKACHWFNLQPLWTKDNLSKGSKIL